jgi:uncharacterized protein
MLCGSAFGEMRRFIDGQAPLRGRAMLDSVVRAFDYRVMADYWGLKANPTAAFHLHSFIGGTPAYRVLAGADHPVDGDIDGWVQPPRGQRRCRHMAANARDRRSPVARGRPVLRDQD